MYKIQLQYNYTYKHTGEFIQHPMLWSCYTLQMLLGTTSLSESFVSIFRLLLKSVPVFFFLGHYAGEMDRGWTSWHTGNQQQKCGPEPNLCCYLLIK